MLEFERKEIPLRKELISKIPPNLPPNDLSRLERRLLLFHARALIVADEGSETEITRIFRKMTVYNPIPSQFRGWENEKVKNIPLAKIIEDPFFKKSQDSFFIQLADCVAFALLKREVVPTENIKKYGIHNFFDECLGKICYKQASPSDPLGIVRK